MELYGRVNGSQEKPHYSRSCTVSSYIINGLSCTRKQEYALYTFWQLNKMLESTMLQVEFRLGVI